MAIFVACDHTYECPEHGLEKLILNQSDPLALRRYALALEQASEWPGHLNNKAPSTLPDDEAIKDALFDYFRWQKATGSIALFLDGCVEAEMPEYVRETLALIRETVLTPAVFEDEVEDLDDDVIEEEVVDEEAGSA